MIEQAQLDQVLDLVRRQGVGSGTVEQLRQQLPELHFTYCMDDDVGEMEPIHQDATFNLYLVDGRNHCLCFTRDLSAATGLVLAEVVED